MSIRLKNHRLFGQVETRCFLAVCFGTLLSTLAPGCTALHPIRGVPASYLPDQFEGPSRDNKRTIDLSLLVRTPPDQYRIAAGDVLSIYVPRVLGSQSTDVNSVGIEPPINMPASIEDPPTVGYPIQVRDNNTIALPQIPPLNVGGMTLHEVEQAIHKAYSVDHRILNPEEAMVLVSLQRPRIHRVLVVRQEANTSLEASSQPGSVNIGTTGKGTARTVTLKAYENDVLHALSQGEGVDGLPGLNAENVIYIIRRRHRQVGGVNCPTPGQNIPGQILGRPPYGQPLPDADLQLQAPSDNDPYLMPPATGQRQQSTQTGLIRPVSYEQSAMTGNANDVSLQAGAHGQQGQIHQPGPGVAAPAATRSGFGSYRGAASGSMHSVANAPNSARTANPVVVIPAGYAHSPQQVTQTQYSVPPQYGEIQNAPPQYGPPQDAPPQYVPAQQYAPGPHYAQPHAQPQPTPAMPQGHSLGVIPPEPSIQPGMTPDGMSPGSAPYGQGYEQGWGSMLATFDPTIDNPNIIRIPIRLGPGEQPNITEELITLYDGDIVFIDSRETEVFYTAGLLGGGQYTLPRDYDLGVLEAVSIAEGRSNGGGSGLNRSIGGVSALNHDVANSASRLAILRTLPNGKRITIEVDLNKAMRYQQENIRIQPGDILFLQYTFPEAVCAFTQRYLLEGALFSVAAAQMQSNR